MELQIILFLLAGAAIVWMLLNPLTKNKKPFDDTPIKNPNETTDEIISIDTPVEADPEPTNIPSDEEGEMPIKPIPINCQKAIFRPAPEKYYYVDCCGNKFEGEGYQPWEKRSPVSIDVNSPFEGMDLLDEESNVDC